MNYHPSHFALTFWAIWFIIWFTTFLTYELWQLAAGRPQNTLSAAVWHMLSVVKGQPITQWSFFHLFFIGLFVLTMVWLTGHFAFGIWAG